MGGRLKHCWFWKHITLKYYLLFNIMTYTYSGRWEFMLEAISFAELTAAICILNSSTSPAHKETNYSPVALSSKWFSIESRIVSPSGLTWCSKQQDLWKICEKALIFSKTENMVSSKPPTTLLQKELGSKSVLNWVILKVKQTLKKKKKISA